MASGLPNLLYAKWRGMQNNVLKEAGGMRSRLLTFAVLGGTFWMGTFAGVYWFVDQCQRVEIFGDVLVEQLVSMVLLIVFSVLLFSNLVASFSTYYLADDLRFLMSRPVTPYALFSARFTELLVQSSWMVALFSLPVFVSVGIVYKLGPLFYLRIPLVILPLLGICTAVATLISLLMTNILPARRTREILLLLSALAFVILFVVFRSLQPERFLNPDERAGIVELLSTFSAPHVSLLPSEWAFQALWPSFLGGDGGGTFYFGCLYSSALATYFTAAWAFKLLHFQGYSKAQEGRPEGSAPERVWRKLVGSSKSAAERGASTLSRMVKMGGRAHPVSEMRKKDGLTFVRDTAQWTQLVLLAALIVIYLLNFRYFRSMGEGGIIGPVGLYFCNLGLSGFVVTAICVRFVFPSVSLEGRAFWLIRSAPISARRFLRSKWWALLPGIWIVGQALTLLSNVMIDTGVLLMATSLVVQTPASIGIVGLGVGLGAIHPQFKLNNAAQIAAGFGGFVYMVSGVALNLAVVLLSAYPTLVLLRLIAPDRYKIPSEPNLAVAIGLGVAAIALPLISAAIVMRRGARKLETR